MLSVFSTILAILKAVPVIEGWVQDFFVFYTQARLDAMRSENREALKKAFLEKDQRDLEKAIGNPTPGEESGNAGSEIKDTLPPGVNS